MRTFLFASTALAFAMTSNAAFAQNTTSDAAAESQRDDENAIVVTARLRNERLTDVPLAVSVTTAEQLSRDQVYSLTDLQRITPALQVSPSFGGDINGGAGIRGIRTQAFNPSVHPSVAIVVDQAAAGNVTFPILHDVAQVEVLRGPQGTLFGQGASAGVLNVSTVAPELGKLAANFNLDFADDGFAGSEQTEIVARAGLSIPMGDKAALRVAGFFRQEVGLRTNVFLNNLDDKQEQFAVRGRLLLEPTETIRIHLIGDYAEIDEDGVNFFSPTLAPTNPASLANLAACGITPNLISGRARFFCEDVQSQESRSVLSTTARIEADLTDSLTLTSVTSYRKLAVNQVRRNFSVRAVGNAARNENLQTEFKQFTQELRLGYQGNGFDLIAGGYFADFNYGQSPLDASLPFGDRRNGFRTGFSVCSPAGVCNSGPTFVPERAENQTLAFFADATIDLTDKLELFGGLRFTDYNNNSGFGQNTLNPTVFDSISETNLSGRIGLSYQPNPDTTIYGSFAQGYKPSALAFPGNPGDPFIPLAAEKNTAFELGAKTMLGQVQLDFNAFYMSVGNFQGQESLATPGGELVSQPRNIGDVESYGFEVLASGQVNDNLSVNVGYTFNPVLYPDTFLGDDGTDLSRQQLLSAPKHKFVLSGEYVQPVSSNLEAFFNTNIVYRSALRLGNRDTARFVDPAGELVNLRLGVRHADGNWTASLFVRNLTQNREAASSFPLNFRGSDDGSARSFPVAGLTTRVVGASVGFNF